jgi:ArsR family transcriptional regulator, arsenate/arsenite/antimonite-responsive transcriptional repressor
MKTVPVELLFRALGDRTRLRILALLASGEICVCHIHGALGIPQPTASRHLAYLRRVGLVATRREGLWVHYRLKMPAGAAEATILRAALSAIDAAPAERDRRRLSRLTNVPLPVLEQARTCCIDASLDP